MMKNRLPGLRMTNHKTHKHVPPRERQLTLDLPHKPAMGIEDFCLSDCNRQALEFIDRWPDWPAPPAIIAGPTGSGKSHLGAIWKTMSGARRISAIDLQPVNVPALLGNGALLIEDAHIPGFDEAAMFHAINWAAERGGNILITTRLWPDEWQISLPDLISRLKAAPVIELYEPDNALLCMVLVKLFSDRQIPVDAPLVEYLVSRMERSLESAARIVAALDKAALSQKRAITRPLAARVLQDMQM